MAVHMVRHLSRRGMAPLPVVQRALQSTSAVTPRYVPPQYTMMSQADKEVAYPALGNRQMVCYARNGLDTYEDDDEYPCPALTFGDLTTPQMVALKEKEMGDWKNFSVEDKKALYRANFRQTFEEFGKTHKGRWKVSWCYCLMLGTLNFGFFYFLHNYVMNQPRSYTKDWQAKQIALHVIAHNAISYSQWYDYEKKEFKMDKIPID